LFPYLAIARGLAARGHVPVLATARYYEDIVRREGFLFHPIRPDIDPSDRALLERVMDPFKGTEVVVREIVAPALRDSFADLSDATRGAHLIVTHPLTFAGRLVAETTKMRWMSTVLAPASMFSVHDFPVFPPYPAVMRLARSAPFVARFFLRVARRATASWTDPVRAFRRELGLPDAPDPLFEGQFSPHGTLAMFSPVIGSPQADWPAETTQTGFPFYEGDGALPGNVAAFLDAGDPPVVFTLGSSAVGAPGLFFDESLAAIREVGGRAVLLVGRNADRPVNEAPSPSVLVADYAPHAPLFRRARAIVHHGGIGTTAQALRAGRPMLVVPHAHDQQDNARRVVALGVAEAIDARRYRAQAAAAALRRLTEGGRVARAKETGQIVEREDGVSRSAEAILRCVN
jgi:UDP:flavonoid glycosyltransferase YjiC (YdhE family)